jgi:outer membrane lipoprotein carrier protein
MNKRIFPLIVVLAAVPALAQPRNNARPATLAPPRRPAPRPAARPVIPAPRVAAPAPAPAPTPVVASPTPPGQHVDNPTGVLTADEVAQHIQAFYDRTTDFSADFVQVSRNPLYGEERRNGRVMFSKPGRMRWNYAPRNGVRNGDIIVSDGATLWAYQAEEAQALQQTMGQSQLPTAITFLAGTGRITDSFTFRLLDANQFRFPNGYVLELRPTTPQPTYERIVFYVDRASFQVVRTAVIDAQGNQNRFDFSNPQVNLNIPLTTFRWSPPAGTSIVRP